MHNFCANGGMVFIFFFVLVCLLVFYQLLNDALPKETKGNNFLY